MALGMGKLQNAASILLGKSTGPSLPFATSLLSFSNIFVLCFAEDSGHAQSMATLGLCIQEE